MNYLLTTVVKLTICNTNTRCLRVLAPLRHLITTQASVNVSVQALYDRSELHEMSYIFHSLMSNKTYAGTSKQGRERNKQHYTAMLNNYRYKHNQTHQINPAHNTRFYKYITRTGGIAHFHMMPLLLVAKADALCFEDCLIRFLGTHALNEDRRREKSDLARKATQVISSIKNAKSGNKNRKYSKKRKRYTQITKHSPNITHFHSPDHDFEPKLYRMDTDKFFYLRLDNLFKDNEDTTITIHITTGRSHTHSHNFQHCWALSTGTHNDTTYQLNTLAPMIFARTFRGTVQVTPTRRITRDRAIYNTIQRLSIHSKRMKHTKQQHADVLTRIAPLLTPFDWLALFRNTKTIKHDKNMVNTVRRFIRHYMFTSYNISTRQLNTGLSVNITLSYHPNTSITNVKSCHRALVHAITTHNKKLRSVLQNTLYTTFRKTKNIGSYLLNYRNAVKTFDPKSPPPCSHPHLCKKTKHRKHFLFMP